MRSRSITALTLAVLLARCATAQFPTIELHHHSLPAVQAGSHGELQVFGARIDELDQLRFSCSDISAVQQMQEPAALSDYRLPTGKFDVRVGESVAPGLYEVRASGRFGLSNPRTVYVAEKPVVRCPSTNTDAFQSLDIGPDAIYMDQALARARKYFRLTLRAGERLRAVVYSAQLDSRMVPSLILTDDNASELARGRGIRKWPAEVVFEASQDGEYVLVVHDFLFQGGPEYPFLLECAIDAPGQQSNTVELDQFLRPDLRSDRNLCRFSNVSRTCDLAHIDEVNNEHAYATDAEAPGIAPFFAKGSLAAGAVAYDFTAKKGELFWLEVMSSQWDQLTDPSVILFQKRQDVQPGEPALRRLAEQDDASSSGGPDMRVRQRDPYLSWTVPEDGTYQLVVRDHESGQRPPDSLEYLLDVRSPEPGFALLAHRLYPNVNRALAKPVGSNLMRAGTEAILVSAIRQDGFQGPIEVRLDKLPAGVRCDPAVIPPGANETALILRAAEDAPGSNQSVRVLGTGELDGKSISREARTGVVVWGTNSTNNTITTRLCDALHVGVNELDTSPLLVELGDGTTLEARAGETLKIPITVHRREGGTAACLLRAQQLPPKSSLADVQIAADKNAATAELKLNADLAAGEYTFWMQNETKLKWQVNPQALERARAYLEVLKKAVEGSVDQQKTTLEGLIKEQTTVVADMVKRSSQDVTVWMPTTAIRIRVLPAAKS